MIKTRACIKLYKNGRKTPFHTGYRPMFDFIKGTKTSGCIELVDQDKFYPGDEGEVIISFLNKDFLGDDFCVGKKFEFGEGEIFLGEGEIKEILSLL